MKILVSLLIFATALTLNLPALANEEAERDMSTLFPPKHADLTLSARPAKPELDTPTFFQKISDSKASLKWKEAQGAESYHVQVATDPNFKWLVKDEQFVKGTVLEVSGLETGKHYFWRVAGLKPDNKAGYTHGNFSASMFDVPAK